MDSYTSGDILYIQKSDCNAPIFTEGVELGTLTQVHRAKKISSSVRVIVVESSGNAVTVQLMSDFCLGTINTILPCGHRVKLHPGLLFRARPTKEVSSTIPDNLTTI